MVGNTEEREANHEKCHKEQPCKTKLIELKVPDSNSLFSLTIKPVHLRWLALSFARGTQLAVTGHGAKPAGLDCYQ